MAIIPFLHRIICSPPDHTSTCSRLISANDGSRKKRPRFLRTTLAPVVHTKLSTRKSDAAKHKIQRLTGQISMPTSRTLPHMPTWPPVSGQGLLSGVFLLQALREGSVPLLDVEDALRGVDGRRDPDAERALSDRHQRTRCRDGRKKYLPVSLAHCSSHVRCG